MDVVNITFGQPVCPLCGCVAMFFRTDVLEQAHYRFACYGQCGNKGIKFIAPTFAVEALGEPSPKFHTA